MIPTPQGWSAHRGGRETVFVHPDGPEAGVLSYKERCRPLGPLTELVAAACRTHELVPLVTGDPELMFTHEGEHAACVSVRGVIGDQAAQLDLGVVVFEDHHARMAGLSVRAGHFADLSAVVRGSVQGATFLLGPRPRRTHFTPPPGWHRVARGLMTELYPEDHPRHPAVLAVWPALPKAGNQLHWSTIAGQLDLGFVEDELAEPQPVLCDARLRGHSHYLRSDAGGERQIRRIVVALEDDRYLYLCRLDRDGAATEAHEQELRGALAGVVGSMRPIPAHRPAPQRRAAMFDHWL